MKKALKSVVALVFCFVLLSSTAVFSSAISGVTNLKATKVIYNSATLTWTKVKNADGYQIRPYTGGKYGKTLSTTSTTYKVSLTPGKSYYLYVRAYDKKLSLKGYKYEYSSWSKVAVKAVPAKVTGLKATQSGSSVKLTWTKVPSITAYAVQKVVSGKYKTIKTGLTTNSYTVTKQPYGSTQQFRVVAYKTYNKKNIYGSYSSAAKVTLKTAAPKTIKVKNVTTSTGTLYWSGSTGATGYQVYRYSASKKAYVKVGTTTKKELKVTGLYTGTAYKFKVRSYVKYGSAVTYSSWSSVYSFTTVPAKLTGLKVTDITDTSCKVSWTAGKSCLGYQLYKYDYAVKKWAKVKNTTGTSLNVTGLEPNTKYAFKVRGYIKNDSTYYYTSYSSIQYPVTKMAAPVISSTYDSTNSYNLSWTAVSGATEYILERYNNTTYTWDEVIRTAETTYIDKNSTVRAALLYRVRAVNAAGEEGVLAKGTTCSPTPITVTKDAYSATVTWGDIENTASDGTNKNIVKYEVRTKPINKHKDVVSYWSTVASTVTVSDLDSYTFNLTPGAVNSFMIYAWEKDSTVPFTIGPIDVDADDLKIDSSDKSTNAQLLYFINAINLTKAEQNKVTATLKSTTAMSCDKLKIGGSMAGVLLLEMPSLVKYYKSSEDAFVVEGSKNIAEFMGALGEDATDDFGQNETNEATYTFENGVATSEDGSTISLINFVEPSTSNQKYPMFAYLYDYLDFDAWKNGFSSVKTTAHSNGTYTFTATLKAEEYGTGNGLTKTKYHGGLSKTYDELDFSDMLEGMGETNSNTKVGATKITAKIDKDGKLLSYKLTSPVSSAISAVMTLEESESTNSEDGLLDFSITVSGDLDVNYTFKR